MMFMAEGVGAPDVAADDDDDEAVAFAPPPDTAPITVFCRMVRPNAGGLKLAFTWCTVRGEAVESDETGGDGVVVV